METPPSDSLDPGPRVEPAAAVSPLSLPRDARESGVSVRVGRLVLDGFALPLGGERQVRAAFQQELIRLLLAGDLPSGIQSGGVRRRLPGKPLDIGAWTDPIDLGSRIARAIHEGMGALTASDAGRSANVSAIE